MVFVLAALDQYNRAQSDRVGSILADHGAHALEEVLQHQRDGVTRLEAATICRLDLALKRMETIKTALSQIQTEFKSTARKRDAWSIALNFAFALLYIMMGAVIALLAMHLALKWHLF
jgi:CHASE3 domain sensor protein